MSTLAADWSKGQTNQKVTPSLDLSLGQSLLFPLSSFWHEVFLYDYNWQKDNIVWDSFIPFKKKKEIRCVKKLVTTEHASIAGRKERKIKETIVYELKVIVVFNKAGVEEGA